MNGVDNQWTEPLGWAATTVFILSYACRGPMTMCIVQAGGAVLWIAYGALLGSPPVIVANVLVAGAALLSVWRSRDRAGSMRPLSAEPERENAA